MCIVICSAHHCSLALALIWVVLYSWPLFLTDNYSHSLVLLGTLENAAVSQTFNYSPDNTWLACTSNSASTVFEFGFVFPQVHWHLEIPFVWFQLKILLYGQHCHQSFPMAFSWKLITLFSCWYLSSLSCATVNLSLFYIVIMCYYFYGSLFY